MFGGIEAGKAVVVSFLLIRLHKLFFTCLTNYDCLFINHNSNGIHKQSICMMLLMETNVFIHLEAEMKCSGFHCLEKTISR